MPIVVAIAVAIDGDDQAVAERIEHQRGRKARIAADEVVEDIVIPLQREAVPLRDRARIVEREDHQQQNRRPQEKIAEDRLDRSARLCRAAARAYRGGFCPDQS